MRLEIPLRNGLPRFSIITELENNSYKFYFNWNETAQYWLMSISGIKTELELNGIILTTGPDLIKPYKSKHSLGQIFVKDMYGRNADPNFDEFGTRFLLVYQETTEEEPIENSLTVTRYVRS